MMSSPFPSTSCEWMEGGDQSSRGAGLGATWWDGSLWDSDTGSGAGTCGIWLGWDSTWEHDILSGPLTEKTGRRVKLVARSAVG